jgi:crotonobetainyl-CoA:carnitine CoA-transferase CaiB-like acyl-CoA transferase
MAYAEDGSMVPRLSPERRAEAVKAYLAKPTQRHAMEIGEQYGISATSVVAWASAARNPKTDCRDSRQRTPPGCQPG